MPSQVFPKQLLLQKLPPELDILCTHPMFGPNSGSGSWKGLNFQYEKVWATQWRLGTARAAWRVLPQRLVGCGDDLPLMPNLCLRPSTGPRVQQRAR